MVADVLGVLASLAAALAVAFPLGGLLKQHPVLFYTVAAAVVIAYTVQLHGAEFALSAQVFMQPLRKGYAATFLLALVMFTGALPERSAVRHRLRSVRAELSILSLILYLPHVLTFLPSYLTRLGMLLLLGNVMSVSIVLALALTAIYVLLAVLSLRGVRARMPYGVWKAIQRLSYLMVALLVVHIWLAVGKSALFGAFSDMRLALALYTVLAMAYAVLRLCKAWSSRCQ